MKASPKAEPNTPNPLDLSFSFVRSNNNIKKFITNIKKE